MGKTVFTQLFWELSEVARSMGDTVTLFWMQEAGVVRTTAPLVQWE